MKLRTLTIRNPIWVKDGMAYFAISDWTFRALGIKSGKLAVEVYLNGEYKGYNVVERGKWKRECEHKEERVKLRPDEPMTFYYGRMQLIKPSSQMSDREMSEMFLR